MKISNIKIKNYRLLRDFSIDLESELSLVIGKNNTGKTSILTLLEKFLSFSEKHRFSYDDFSIEYRNSLKPMVEGAAALLEKEFNANHENGIKLFLTIEYGPKDNLGNINKIMMDLDPANNAAVLCFGYELHFTDYVKLREDYAKFKKKQDEKKAANKDYEVRGVLDFIKENHGNYFRTTRKSVAYNFAAKVIDESNFIDLIAEKINLKDIINFKYISAKREVANTSSDKTLSAQTSRIYDRTEISDGQNEIIESFKSKLSEADVSLSGVYKNLFENVISKVRNFGGIKISDSDIAIVSTLRHQELLAGNTTVVYKHDAGDQLPEHYNGLGYMNLISMIFEIEILLQEFKRERETKPADVNLLFIEEPEAHTHPQMQYVFIKNIKKLISEGVKRSDGENRPIQYIISTHSSHIVADSDFDDIKYLKKDKDGVKARNLKDLRKQYEADPKQYQFLKQYLTISRAEIFFADKAILIEGDTERILVPTMMKKLDMAEAQRHEAARTKDEHLPLLSQNISIVEVGAYSQIFGHFIEFVGIKSLIITDLDAAGVDGTACEVAKGTTTSNSALQFFFGSDQLANFKAYSMDQKRVRKAGDAWEMHADGRVCVVYQTDENAYTGRSFEDSFIHINRAFIAGKKAEFRGLKNRGHFDDKAKDAYDLAEQCILKKTHFALDILFHSDEKFSNWQTPAYINDGLLWLKKD